MGKYFGTDGFRGEAGITLTADHAYKVGRFLGWYYGMLRQRNGEATTPRIALVIGVAWGQEKVKAIKACLVGSYISALATDQATAESLLA